MANVRVPLRWAGSKRKSISSLTALMPRVIETYVEPFAGSACVAFTVSAQARILGDINAQLVEFYETLKTSPQALYDFYAAVEATPANYYRIRAAFNTGAPSLERAAQFLFLNRNCFNGIYRVNAAGAFNVPWGGDKVGKALSREDLLTASRALQNATFLCADFENVVDQGLAKGAFVYLDPPYARDEQRVFREYHEDSFSTKDWARLLATLKRIDKAGACFLLSYAGDDSLVDQLQRWNVGHLDVTRNVGGFKASRRKHREFIATNYSHPDVH